MIQIDYSQLIIASAFAFSSDFEKGKDTKKMVDLLRHTILTTLLGDKKKYSKEYGEIVMAIDDREYWRRDYFPHYKGTRKKGREESKTDWGSIFSIGSQLREEFKETFPYRFVQANKAEADDVIAVLCKWLQTNECEESAFHDDPQNILIKSNDGDFGQLHKYKNVRQWDPLMKKYKTKVEKHFLLEKCITGDVGDGIPNIRSRADFFMNPDGSRQKSITAKIKAAAIAQVEAGLPVTFDEQDMNTNYHRNRTLIDFDYIPQDVSDRIIAAYISSKPVVDKGKIFNYFMTHRMKVMMQSIQEF